MLKIAYMEANMQIYLGFDDTDDHDSPMGTGRLVREFCHRLPEGFSLTGIVRHQLPRLEDIPFTSNNSSACAIINVHPDASTKILRDQAVDHLKAHCAPGSDPGLCIALEADVTSDMVEFGQCVTGRRVSQQEAMTVARPIELLGLGGTNDGIIGATAAVGLTKFGWCGRFIEYGGLRSLPSSLSVRELMHEGIRVISVDRDPLVPQPGDNILGASWIRPSLWGGQPTLQVRALGHGVWEPAHGKRGKRSGHQPKPRKMAATTPGIA